MRISPLSATRAGGVALTLVLIFTAQAQAKDRCAEQKGPTPQPKFTLRQLDANTQRPTFTLPLDSQKDAADDITLPVKGRKKVGTLPRAATARVEQPRKGNRRLKADIRVSAQPTELGTGVTVFACITNKDVWEAGTYEGFVQVYGTRFGEFSYPLVVTTKWPVWIPLSIIAAVLIVFLFFEIRRPETGATGAGAYTFIATAAGAITYFAQYHSVDTWGDQPEAQLAGLAVAVLAGAATGRAAAVKYFSE